MILNRYLLMQIRPHLAPRSSYYGPNHLLCLFWFALHHDLATHAFSVLFAATLRFFLPQISRISLICAICASTSFFSFLTLLRLLGSGAIPY
ncbi:hypothetical protein VNO77_24035 [Canavalia gladiata]|uniref:Uncharacterized protein n=1 Tax=Canavalia gladiata TaxID=3824 RepID=A0AAN9QCC4_CANGL